MYFKWQPLFVFFGVIDLVGLLVVSWIIFRCLRPGNKDTFYIAQWTRKVFWVCNEIT